MTALAALAREGAVYMAADGQTNIGEQRVVSPPKIVRLRVGQRRPYGEVLVGVAGDGALPELLVGKLRLVKEPEEGADPQPWASDVAWQVTEIAVQAGLVDEGRMDAHLLLGWRGRVWTIHHMMAIPQPDGVAAAVGSADGLLLGALDVLLGTDVAAGEALVEAVSIAIARDRNCWGPVQREVLHGAAAGRA